MSVVRRSIAASALLALAMTGLVACTSAGSKSLPDTAGSARSDGFPVTMKHALGSTVIKTRPQRVVTLGWGQEDAVLALGVDPVAMEFQSYGANAQGVPTWVADKISAMHAQMPTVLPKSTTDPAYEAIAKAKPDLILATSSGITAAQYALLSAIAPTVAYTGKPFTTRWQDVVTQTGAALGRSGQAAQLVSGIGKQLTDAATANPVLKGKSVAAVWDVGGTFYVYRPVDPRVDFLLSLGLTSANSVTQLANGDTSFYYTLSYEKVHQVTSDILLTYADTQAGLNSFLAKSYARSLPAVQHGAVVGIIGTTNVAAISPPTALSLPAALPGLVTQLVKAAKASSAASAS